MGVSKMVRFQWKIPWNWMIRGYPHLCKLSHICNYRYMAVDLNSFLCERSFANETTTFANLREPLVYLSRGCNYPLLCCWDAHANGNCVSDPGVPWKTTFPWLAAAKVLWGLLVSRDTFSEAPLLLRNCRETFANPLQINRKEHSLNRGWGLAFTWLH